MTPSCLRVFKAGSLGTPGQLVKLPTELFLYYSAGVHPAKYHPPAVCQHHQQSSVHPSLLLAIHLISTPSISAQSIINQNLGFFALFLHLGLFQKMLSQRSHVHSKYHVLRGSVASWMWKKSFPTLHNITHQVFFSRLLL